MGNRMVGNPAPNFEMNYVDGKGEQFGRLSLDDYRGKWLVLFFYPLDFTTVCPTEISGISNRIDRFKASNAEVLGVSTDSEHSHRAWIHQTKESGGLGTLAFPLAADMTHQVSRDYGVLVEEDGVALRGLYIIDPEGIVRYSVVHDLNVGRSVDETLRVLQALQTGGLCPVDWGPGDEMLQE